ncbi:hypothetical protein [Bacillus cereus group sp. MYBK225-1]|uniref:hypothetical protein n=1 Tax=Bacillus cereus group sp. MYBK225-1 TaxID=3450656 RepID=UPI003F79F57C
MNKKPELQLINKFKYILEANDFVDYKQDKNFGRNSLVFADIEFLSTEGEYFVIEAKSHHSKDAYNSYHKLFGELLKETGKNKPIRDGYGKNLSLAILIPTDSCDYEGVTSESGTSFYRRQFKNIPLANYIGFGELVSVKYVFACSEEANKIQMYTWSGFYKNEDPVRVWGLCREKSD